MSSVSLTDDELDQVKKLHYSKGYTAGKRYGLNKGKELKIESVERIQPGTNKNFRGALKALITNDDTLPLNGDDVDRLCQHSAFALSFAYSMEE